MRRHPSRLLTHAHWTAPEAGDEGAHPVADGRSTGLAVGSFSDFAGRVVDALGGRWCTLHHLRVAQDGGPIHSNSRRDRPRRHALCAEHPNELPTYVGGDALGGTQLGIGVLGPRVIDRCVGRRGSAQLHPARPVGVPTRAAPAGRTGSHQRSITLAGVFRLLTDRSALCLGGGCAWGLGGSPPSPVAGPHRRARGWPHCYVMANALAFTLGRGRIAP